MPLIICEGADNSGKTTLATRIEDKLNYEIIHSPGPGTREHLLQFSIEILTRCRLYNERILLDRFCYFSEQIYGPILRNGPAFTDDDLSDIRIELMRTTPLVIFCHTYDPNIGLDGKWQLEGVVENYRRIREAYKFYFAPYQHALGWFSLYDYTQKPLVDGTWAMINDFTTARESKNLMEAKAL